MTTLLNLYASAHAATVSVIFITLVTVYAELSPEFKTWLASLTGHHWISKSWLVLLAFVAFFLVFRLAKSSADDAALRRAVRVLFLVIAVASFILLAFFYIEYFFR